MNTVKRLAGIGLTLVLSACNGGGSDAQSNGGSTSPANQLPGGLWYGTLTLDAAMGSEELLGMIGEDGKFRFVTADTAIQMSGTVVVAGSALSGSGKAFAGPGSIWPDGSTVGDVSMNATITQRDSIAGAWSTTATESGTFELSYDDFYERDSALTMLAGMWTAYDDFGNPTVTFTIQDAGSFDGQNAQGCVSSGQFSIIDARYDLYAVQSTISGCPIAGDYTGLAVVFDLVTQNDAMFFAVDNGSTAVLLGLQK